MLREARTRLHTLSYTEFERVATELCCSSLEVFPIFECVKVFARLNSVGDVTYARHPEDVNRDDISLFEVSSRIKDSARAAAVELALTELESALKLEWPFSAGSSTWLQLEILHPSIQSRAVQNSPSIVIRKACRLRTRGGRVICESSPVVERIFERFKPQCPQSLSTFSLLCAPSITLKNIAGHGVLSESVKLASEGLLMEASSYLTKALIYENKMTESTPGFFFEFGGEQIRVVSDKYFNKEVGNSSKMNSTLPIPIAGWVK